MLSRPGGEGGIPRNAKGCMSGSSMGAELVIFAVSSAPLVEASLAGIRFARESSLAAAGVAVRLLILFLLCFKFGEIKFAASQIEVFLLMNKIIFYQI